MITGGCPYADCNGPLFRPLADNCPAFEKHDCEQCGRTIWTKHSRIDPESYTEENFHKAFEVDEATKSLKRRT